MDARPTLDDARARAARAYNAAADSYDAPANSFWDRFGLRTVERLDLEPGARVLDVCCGSGASAIPAAERVGPAGSVLGVDLAKNLLELGRRKAAGHGFSNLEFRAGDLLELGLPKGEFDAVVCVFGVFFVPDMVAAVRALWRSARPGGQLAVTTWGPRFFEPVNSAFWNSIRSVRPDLYKCFNPWDRISEPDAVRALFAAADAEPVDVVAESGTHPVGSPADWWSMVLGSGYRGTLEELSAGERERVRTENAAFIRAAGIEFVEANVVYAVATKSAR